jgi:putative transposase
VSKLIYDPEKHHRRSIRLKNYDYSSNGGYFITLVTKNREDFFGEIVNGEMFLSEMGKVAYNNWLDITNHFENVILDEFVIMPNHIHSVIFLDEERGVKFYALTEENELQSDSNSNFDNVTLNHLIREELYDFNYNFEEETDLTEETTEEKTVKEINSFDNSYCGGVKLYAQSEQPQKTLANEKNNYFSNLSPKKNTISSIIRSYKASVTSNCRKINHHEFQWQRNYYEHIIRNEKSLNNIRKYIKENPMKWFIDRENEKGQFEKYKFKNMKEINDFDIRE